MAPLEMDFDPDLPSLESPSLAGQAFSCFTFFNYPSPSERGDWLRFRYCSFADAVRGSLLQVSPGFSVAVRPSSCSSSPIFLVALIVKRRDEFRAFWERVPPTRVQRLREFPPPPPGTDGFVGWRDSTFPLQKTSSLGFSQLVQLSLPVTGTFLPVLSAPQYSPPERVWFGTRLDPVSLFLNTGPFLLGLPPLKE